MAAGEGKGDAPGLGDNDNTTGGTTDSSNTGSTTDAGNASNTSSTTSNTTAQAGTLVAKAKTNAQGKIEFSGLVNKYQYRLHESSAPSGSLQSAKDVVFHVASDGSIVIDDKGSANDANTLDIDDDGTLIWNEPQTEYKFLKLNEEGAALSGASLQVIDNTGAVVDAWTTGQDAHEIIGVLAAGETYTLVETQAPLGYDVAAPISFTVESTPASPGRMHAHTIVMVDTLTPPAPEASNGTTDANATSTNLASTGDALGFAIRICAGIVLFAGVVFVAAIFARKRKQKS